MKRKALYITISAVFGGVCVVTYAIDQTGKHIDKIVDTRVLCRKRNAEYIYIKEENLRNVLSDNSDPLFELRSDEWMPTLQQWWERRKKLFIWRLLEISNSSDQNDRRRAVEILASYTNLHDYEYHQLAQACNAQTAVALARIKNVDKRFFLKPRHTNIVLERKELINSMKTLLFKLCSSSRHPCLSYFLNKMFPKYSKYKAMSDLDIYGFIGIPPTTISEDTILPLCIDALVHHCAASGNAKDFVEAGALELLFHCHKELCTDMNSCYNISRVLMQVSTYPEFLQDLFQTGWIAKLAEWINHSDNRLSMAAASTLANLDGDNPVRAKYHKEVLLLHPTYRSKETINADVVLIHGLLGGAHYTWRQRGQRREPISIFGEVFSLWKFSTDKLRVFKSRKSFSISPGLTTPGEPLLECARTTNFIIDEAPEEVRMGNLGDKTSPESGYVFVMTDIPTSESICCKTCDPCTIAFDGTDKCQMDSIHDTQYTMCWPRDWLAKDCRNLRVVGVDYDSRITDWRQWCPLTDKRPKRIMPVRCKNLLQQLIECGIGDRPVIWIAHSMGGLMLKHMLMQAWANSDEGMENICKNTKAIVFFSTPHIGAPLATLHEVWRILIMPSTELDELRYKSPALEKLHKDFLKFVEEHPIKIVSFVETKSLKISALELEFHCVPPNIGDTGTGVIYEIPLGHLDICKPDGKHSFIYQRILSLIRSLSSEEEIPKTDNLHEEDLNETKKTWYSV